MLPLLVTMDLEVAPDRDLAAQASVLDRLRRDFDAIGVRATVFVTADAAERFSAPLSAWPRAGHSIGCHGLRHGPDERFDRLTPSQLCKLLDEATARIEAAIGLRPRLFRGPWMTTSAAAHEVLGSRGYVADFSTCAQRLDFVKRRGGTAAWLRAPRHPYRASRESPHRRGTGPLLAVPMRCYGAPPVSGLLYLGAGVLLAAMLRASLAEGRHRCSPAVYLFHSYEFAAMRPDTRDRRPLSHRLYASDPERRYESNLALLRSLTARQEVEALSADAWLEEMAA